MLLEMQTTHRLLRSNLAFFDVIFRWKDEGILPAGQPTGTRNYMLQVVLLIDKGSGIWVWTTRSSTIKRTNVFG